MWRRREGEEEGRTMGVRDGHSRWRIGEERIGKERGPPSLLTSIRRGERRQGRKFGFQKFIWHGSNESQGDMKNHEGSKSCRDGGEGEEEGGGREKGGRREEEGGG
jgi:hypothetical protein